MVSNVDTGKEWSFYDFIEKMLKKYGMRYILVSVIDLHRMRIYAKESMVDCYENGYRPVCYWREKRRAMLDDASIHDDLENLYEDIKCSAFEIRNNFGKVDGIKSFSFQKLEKKELNGIERRDQAVLNTFHRYGKCNKPKESKFFTDNLKYLDEDELELKFSESKSRYALMVCFRFTMLLGNPDFPEYERWSHLLVKLTTKSEAVYSLAFSFGFGFIVYLQTK